MQLTTKGVKMNTACGPLAKSTRALVLGFGQMVLFCSMTATSLCAQAVGRSNSGPVTDASGSVVPGATVEAMQQELAFRRIVISDANGGYNLPNLPVGPYQLGVSATGFSAYRQTGIAIRAGNNLRIDIPLQVVELYLRR